MTCKGLRNKVWLAAFIFMSVLILGHNLSNVGLWGQNTEIHSSPQVVEPFPTFANSYHNDTIGQYENLTVVTAYLNIGSFGKGSNFNKFTPETYIRWMKVFAHLRNPVVAYLDSDESVRQMRRFRAGLPAELTHIVRVHREELRSFTQYLKPISNIFKRSGYPRHLPNTMVPEYSCVMHAKYELMNRTVHRNPFGTTYFAWLDVGLFRTLANQPIKDFKLTFPLKFNPSKVAYTQVNRRTPGLTPQQIVTRNQVWVCGCFFLGAGPLLTRLADMYFREVDAMLAERWMSTDQQVLYSLYNRQRAPAVEVQTYHGDGRFDAWFHLGYVCRDSWLKANIKTQQSGSIKKS